MNKRYFRWPPEAEEMLTVLKIKGYSTKEISNILSDNFGVEIDIPSTSNKLDRMGLRNLVERNPAMTIYKAEELPMGDYLISADYHSPFYSELWVNRLLTVAQKTGIDRHIIVGDLFDCDWAKSHPSTDGEIRPGLDGEAECSDPLIKALLTQFNETYLVCGNHETRAARNIAKVQFKHIAGFLGLDLAKQGFMFTEKDHLFVGNDWMVVHPKSYSQVSGAVGVRLAEKYHRNILTAHGHFAAERVDRSGDFVEVDLGGMFDTKKIGYINLTTTTHPDWNNGFVMFRNGHHHRFTKWTDFTPWLNGSGK